ncbi:MAG: hypothetical protein K0S55_304 [Clostridia bacterium]|jgi:hypothetical protein|nr:hypothetical protein [Clostridia bacterium]
MFALIASMFILTSCGGNGNEADTSTGDSAELAKLPEDFPISSAPLYKMVELVSISNNNSENYISYDITFNSDANYDELVEYYSGFFEKPIIKDFGIALNVVYVPENTGYMCNYNIFSDKSKGEKGTCTVTMTVSTY